MEKWKIVDLANLKCKGRNQYYSSCPICQCYWVDVQNGRIMIFFNSTQTAVMSEKNKSLQTEHYSMYPCVYFPMLCSQSFGGKCGHSHGSLMPYMDQLQCYINIC
jgi:hypothetical protein